MRPSQKKLSAESAAIAVTTLLPFLLPILCPAQQLAPAEALERYLARAGDPQRASSDSVFNVQIDASIPALHKQGSMTGLKLVSYTGQVVYQGLRFTGDKLVKTAVIARFLSNDTNPSARLRTSRFHDRTIGSPTTRSRITTGLPHTCFS